MNNPFDYNTNYIRQVLNSSNLKIKHSGLINRVDRKVDRLKESLQKVYIGFNQVTPVTFTCKTMDAYNLFDEQQVIRHYSDPNKIKTIYPQIVTARLNSLDMELYGYFYEMFAYVKKMDYKYSIMDTIEVTKETLEVLKEIYSKLSDLVDLKVNVTCGENKKTIIIDNSTLGRIVTEASSRGANIPNDQYNSGNTSNNGYNYNGNTGNYQNSSNFTASDESFYRQAYEKTMNEQRRQNQQSTGNNQSKQNNSNNQSSQINTPIIKGQEYYRYTGLFNIDSDKPFTKKELKEKRNFIIKRFHTDNCDSVEAEEYTKNINIAFDYLSQYTSD
jgi:hypothetical protein